MSALPIEGQEAVRRGSHVAQVLHIMCRQDSCWCLYFKLLFDPSILEPVFSPMQTSNPQSTSDVCVQRSCTTSWLLRRDCGLPTIMLVFMFVVFVLLLWLLYLCLEMWAALHFPYCWLRLCLIYLCLFWYLCYLFCASLPSLQQKRKGLVGGTA